MTFHRTTLAGVALGFACILLSQTGFAANAKTKLTMQQARIIATQKEPGQIQSQELEKEHGRLIYSFDVKTQQQVHEVNVDANTGKVVEDSIEDPAAEARENAQESKHNSRHK